MNTVNADPVGARPPAGPARLLHRWPTAAGLAFAAFVAFGTGLAGHDDIAPVVTASGFVYLAAAALQRRAAAWPMFLVASVLITIGSVAGLDPAWSSWSMLAVVAALAVYGVTRGALRPPWGMPLQAGAMILLAGTAIIAVSVADPTWAGLLVGAALLAHAAWDVHHHRTQRVVARSMAEFCAVLDTLLAVVVLAATFSRSTARPRPQTRHHRPPTLAFVTGK